MSEQTALENILIELACISAHINAALETAYEQLPESDTKSQLIERAQQIKSAQAATAMTANWRLRELKKESSNVS